MLNLSISFLSSVSAIKCVNFLQWTWRADWTFEKTGGQRTGTEKKKLEDDDQKEEEDEDAEKEQEQKENEGHSSIFSEEETLIGKPGQYISWVISQPRNVAIYN